MKISTIDIDTWLNYFQDSWTQKNITNYPLTFDYITDNNIQITLENLENMLNTFKNNKVPGEDCINVELFKFSSNSFKRYFLNFLNKILMRNRPPISWQKAIVIPLHKKRKYQ